MTTKSKKQIMLRLPDATVDRLDAVVAQQRKDRPGLPVSRVGVAYMLLEAALAAWNHDQDVRDGLARSPAPACAVCGDTKRIANDIPCPACSRPVPR